MDEETECQLKILKGKIQEEMMKELKKELQKEVQEMKKQLLTDMKTKKMARNSQMWEHVVEVRILREELERQRRDFMEREQWLRESYENRTPGQSTGPSNEGGLVDTAADIIGIIANPQAAVARGAVGLVSAMIGKGGK